MKRASGLSILDHNDDGNELRERMGQVRALIADRDIRTATLVQRVLHSFGVRNVEMATDGERALELLKSRPFDFLITEFNMHPFDGLTLVKTIRSQNEDKRIRRDIPIVMLTAYAERDNVQAARDAGITEFIVKPFSAKTISSRIIQIIDRPRVFVETADYVGPCRRRRSAPLPAGMVDRRALKASTAHVSPPDYGLLGSLGIDSAREIITEQSVNAAQDALMGVANEFVSWAKDEIETLQAEFAALKRTPDSMVVQFAMRQATYAIQSQAGIFGYALGTEVASMLLTYLVNHPFPTAKHLLVIEKHIDTIRVVFDQNVEKGDQRIAREVIVTLKKLISKME